MIRYETINEAGARLAEKIRQKGIEADGEAIVFVGALGICVRRILPMVNDKYTDPAVICVDTTGRYVIPVLSGHVGGANELARRIAAAIGAEAVVTTQSDNQGLWPLDTIAGKFGWNVRHIGREKMNKAIAAFVGGADTALVIEHKDEGTDYLRRTLPEHVTPFDSYEEYEKAEKEYALLIIVSPRLYDTKGVSALQYCPQTLSLGVGCQKDTPAEAADDIIRHLEEKGYARESVSSLNTVAIKKDEPMLGRLRELLAGVRLNIYAPEELADIDVPNPSEKVRDTVGCYGVAEASAIMAADGGKLCVEKQKGKVEAGGRPYYYTWALAGGNGMTVGGGHIEIVGAGPGDPELVSVRGKRFLENADLILYAGSLVPKELTFYAKPTAVVRSSADMDLEEQFQLMKDFYDRGKLVVRLHTGDPCIYGAIQEQMAFFDKYSMHYHITPGISSFLAAAAELKSQFTIPEKCQTIILTRGEGRTPMPPKEKLRLLAGHQSTMCIFLSASIVDEVMKELLEGGYPPTTPVAACYKLTWKEQRIYRGELKDLARILKDNHLTLTTMIVVGDAIDNRQGLSKLYDGHFTHLFRKAKK